MALPIEEKLDNAVGNAPTKALPEIEELHSLLTEDPELPAELIENVLHRGCKMIIGGSSKSFKSWLLIDLAMAVAGGGQWLGMQCIQGPVLYVNLEIQKPFFVRRMKAIIEKKEECPQEGQLFTWHLRGHTSDLGKIAEKIIERAKELEIIAIIIDPIYKCYQGRDENSAAEIAEVLNELDVLAEQTGAAVIFGAHFTKGNQASKEAMDRISGSGVFARDPDAIVTLTKHKEEEALVVEFILRNCPPKDSFVVVWQYPLMMPRADLDPRHLKGRGGRERQFFEDQIAMLLNDGPLTFNDLRTRFEEDCGGSRATFIRLLNKAKSMRLIFKNPQTEMYSRADEA